MGVKISDKNSRRPPQLSRLFRREARKKVSESVVRVGCGLGGRVEGGSCQKGRVPHQPPEAAWGLVGLFADGGTRGLLQ